MSDLKERLSALDGLDAPDLWPSASRNAPGSLPRVELVRHSTGRRLAAAVLAVVVFGGASFLLMRAFRPDVAPVPENRTVQRYANVAQLVSALRAAGLGCSKPVTSFGVPTGTSELFCEVEGAKVWLVVFERPDATIRGRNMPGVHGANWVVGTADMQVARAVQEALGGRIQAATAPARSLPPVACPAVNPSPAPGYHISCEQAVRQAWEAASYLQSATVAIARTDDVQIAETYSMPAWIVTFTDGHYVAGVDGCTGSGLISPHEEWQISQVSGRLLGFPPHPPGCTEHPNPSPIEPTYSGTSYEDPAGWQIEIPYGWYSAPVDITTASGAHVQGLRIMNPIAMVAPRVIKQDGAPAQPAMVGTYQIEVVIATDTDPSLNHRPVAALPLDLSRSAPVQRVGSNARTSGGSIRVASVHASGGDVSITVGMGPYATPDDRMLLNDMLASFRLKSG